MRDTNNNTKISQKLTYNNLKYRQAHTKKLEWNEQREAQTERKKKKIQKREMETEIK